MFRMSRMRAENKISRDEERAWIRAESGMRAEQGFRMSMGKGLNMG